MRFVANENIPLILVEALRNHNHDVLWVKTDCPGSSDRDVIHQAIGEKRLLLTFDKDFGELAFRFGLPSSCGIILLRVSAGTPDRLTEMVLSAIESRDDWTGHFSVIEQTRIRMTILPQYSQN